MPLAFLADENVEVEIVEALRGIGHEVIYAGESLPGSEDSVLLDGALRHGRLLITDDKDFGELVFRQRRSSAGVVLLRLPGMKASIKAAHVVGAVRRYGERLLGSFLVIGERTMRMRRVPDS